MPLLHTPQPNFGTIAFRSPLRARYMQVICKDPLDTLARYSCSDDYIVLWDSQIIECESENGARWSVAAADSYLAGTGEWLS
jgi:hypothetical protein